MKKLFLSLVAAMMAATATFAQSTLVATLTHGENVSMFYGTNALRDAINKAVSGDVINLSGGAFQSVEIKKAVTLRGSGIDTETPTYIINNFNISIPSSDKGRLSMEGIRCSGEVSLTGTFSNPYFLKCQFADIYFGYNRVTWNSVSTTIKNVMFADCKITGTIESDNGDKSTMQFINCFIYFFSNYYGNTSAAFMNCVNRGAEYVRNSQFANCILYPSNDDLYNRFDATSIASNCVAVQYKNFFADSQASSGCKIAS